MKNKVTNESNPDFELSPWFINIPKGPIIIQICSGENQADVQRLGTRRVI